MRLRLWLLVALALAALAAGWLAVTGGRAQHVLAELPQPRAVRPGLVVIYAGVEVGRVHRVECRDSAALLTLELERHDLALTRAHRLRHRQLFPIGEAVEIVAFPEAGAAPPLESDDTLRGAPPAPLSPADSAIKQRLERAGVRDVTPATCPGTP